jgi:hypothetical protein
LKCLQLLAGNDVIVNIDNHKKSFLAKLLSYLSEVRA